MSFHFDENTRRQLGYKLIDRINAYFSSLPDLPVQLPEKLRTFNPLHDGIPETGEDATAVLDEVFKELIEKGFHVPSANYFGLTNPTPTYLAVLAEALVSALNPQLASMARSQLASRIEHETVRWVGERVGWPGKFDGTFTSGGNEANFSGLALALCQKFPGVVEEGVASIGAQPVFYTSTEAHHSLDKSAGLLGLGRKALRRIPVTESIAMDNRLLEQAILADLDAGRRPFAVVATVGTTSSGAIDDLPAIAALCKKYNLWLHVDGAYGAAIIFSNQHRHLAAGIELGDSLTIDPHKWLAMPFAAGLILTRHPELLETAFGTSTPYMPKAVDAPLKDNFKISAQWSRRMNSLKLWLTLRVHGRQAYEELIARQLDLAHYFARRIERSESLELAAPVRLPILNLRVKASNLSQKELEPLHAAIVKRVTEDGRQWISVTRTNGCVVIRVMVISYLTEERHLDELADTLERVAKEMVLEGTHSVIGG